MIWLIRLQVVLIYFQAAVTKFFVSEWANGTPLYYWWNHSIFGMPISISNCVNYLLSNSLVVTVLTYSVIILEILIFIGLTASIKYRKSLLLTAILFHFLIIIFHGIFSFFFSIAAALILFLYPTYQSITLNTFRLWPIKKNNFVFNFRFHFYH